MKRIKWYSCAMLLPKVGVEVLTIDYRGRLGLHHVQNMKTFLPSGTIVYTPLFYPGGMGPGGHIKLWAFKDDVERDGARLLKSMDKPEILKRLQSPSRKGLAP